jgi:DNA polymerase-3 subunit gamma/tau
LKTIEEPRDNVCFILATTEIQKVPETIISRCQVFNFKKVDKKEIARWLKEIIAQEELTATDEAIELIAKIAEGCVRDAVKYVDQVSVLGNIDEAHITKFLGVASETLIKDFLKLIQGGDAKIIFEKVDEIHNQGIDLNNFAKQTLMHIDEIFLEDIQFSTKISETFTDIIGNIRYYPYPAIVYKVAIHKHLEREAK